MLTKPFYLSGKATMGELTLEVVSPWDGSIVGPVAVPTPEQVDQAVTDLDAVRLEAQALPAHVRADALDHISARLKERSEEIAQLITAENGKPLVWSRGEVGRAVSTFRWASEETRSAAAGRALARARVKATVQSERVRVSAHFYNGSVDADRAAEALASVVST